MREIKFRAWDKTKQEMISWKQLHLEIYDGCMTFWIHDNPELLEVV